MVKAYIMTSMYPGLYTKALDEIKKIDHIEKISVVTCDYDIVVKVNVKNLEHLHKLTSKLHVVNGVEKKLLMSSKKRLSFQRHIKMLPPHNSCYAFVIIVVYVMSSTIPSKI